MSAIVCWAIDGASAKASRNQPGIRVFPDSMLAAADVPSGMAKSRRILAGNPSMRRVSIFTLAYRGVACPDSDNGHAEQPISAPERDHHASLWHGAPRALTQDEFVGRAAGTPVA